MHETSCDVTDKKFISNEKCFENLSILYLNFRNYGLLENYLKKTLEKFVITVNKTFNFVFFLSELIETKEKLRDTQEELKLAIENAGESSQLLMQVEDLKKKLRQAEENHVK